MAPASVAARPGRLAGRGARLPRRSAVRLGPAPHPKRARTTA